MPKKENKKMKTKGGCNCGSGLFNGGAGGDEIVLKDQSSFSLPSASTYTLRDDNLDSSRVPFISNGRDNVKLIGGRRRKKNNTKTKKGCIIMPLMIVPVSSIKHKRNKTSKKKTGGNTLYDFFLGPSNALTPLTSMGTVSGSVYTSNALTNNISATNSHPWSQPINTKFSSTNLVYV